MAKHTLCFVAGKSGGHIIPCLTLARQHCTKNINTFVLFFSADTTLDHTIVSNNPLVSLHIPLPFFFVQIRSFVDYCALPLRALASFIMSVFYLLKYKPTEIITSGGVVALPVCYAGFLLRIPISAYCLDAIPGKAIKALQPIATTINVCFKNAQKFLKNTRVVPYPVKYAQEDRVLPQKQALNTLDLDPQKKTIVILGGSQGSLFLNECIKKWIMDPSFPRQNVQIIHQTGSVDAINWQHLYTQNNIKPYVFSYRSDLAPIYAAADLIICRAGAGTLFEILFFDKKCIVIPLTTKTTTHQIDNARIIAKEYPKNFQWISQDEIEKDVTILFVKIKKLLEI